MTGLYQAVWWHQAHWWIGWTGLDPDLHRRGLGRAMVNTLMGIAKVAGGERLTVETGDHDSATGFYRKLGFEVCGTIPQLYGPTLGGRILTLPLAAPPAAPGANAETAEIPVSIRRVTNVDGDDAVEAVIALYLSSAFTDRERMHVDALQKSIRGEEATLLVAEGEDGQPLGFVIYNVNDIAPDEDRVSDEGNPSCPPQEVSRKVAWCWYLAVASPVRGRGIGQKIYRHLADTTFSEGCEAIILEVENPGLAETDEDAALSERRVLFYQRLGAKHLRAGYRYFQNLENGKRPLRLDLMIHARPGLVLDAEGAFRTLKAVLGDSLQREELVLE